MRCVEKTGASGSKRKKKAVWELAENAFSDAEHHIFYDDMQVFCEQIRELMPDFKARSQQLTVHQVVIGKTIHLEHATNLASKYNSTLEIKEELPRAPAPSVRLSMSSVSLFSEPTRTKGSGESKSSLTSEQRAKVQTLINSLNREIDTCCWYLNNDRKLRKVAALEYFKIETNKGRDAAVVIDEIDREGVQYLDVRAGSLSTRVNDLFNELRPTKENTKLIG